MARGEIASRTGAAKFSGTKLWDARPTLPGLSTGGAGRTECFNRADLHRSRVRMPEYIHVIRELWRRFETGETT